MFINFTIIKLNTICLEIVTVSNLDVSLQAPFRLVSNFGVTRANTCKRHTRVGTEPRRADDPFT